MTHRLPYVPVHARHSGRSLVMGLLPVLSSDYPLLPTCISNVFSALRLFVWWQEDHLDISTHMFFQRNTDKGPSLTS